jgi:hypothetical protein
MDNPQVLFLDMSSPDDQGQVCYESTLAHLTSFENITLTHITSPEAALEMLVHPDMEFDVFLLWLGDSQSQSWRRWMEVMIDDLSYIVIFDFVENVQNEIREAMLQGIYAFVCPFNSVVLGAYIMGLALEVKQRKTLIDFAESCVKQII